MMTRMNKMAWTGVLALLAATVCPAGEGPRMLFQGRGKMMSLMRMPDGSFAFYNRYQPGGGALSLPDAEGREYTFAPGLPEAVVNSKEILESDVPANAQVILTPEGQVVSVFVKGETIDKETAKQVGLSRYLDVWMSQAGTARGIEPHRIWRGYNGSQMEYQQLPGGRIVVPFGSMQPHARAVPPTGRHAVIVLYSDDQGESWKESPSKLTSPCYEGYNGSNEGACEPVVEPLRDGRIWMLMRTQAGFLYESWSTDGGQTWSRAAASRFNTSTGPSNILRHRNGWLAVTWNNCELPPRHEKQGVYGGRDALHIAVSDDEGRTWRGFREIYLDHRRNDNPDKTGDRGTAYPMGAYTEDGTIVILSGQGAGGRNPILIDPEWIVETKAQTDFSDGLKQWSVYKQYGPAKSWWRARAVGCELINNPTEPGKQSLHVRRADKNPADGAVWNFPNGWKGTLKARVMIRKGYEGGLICLNDRFFDPCDDQGEELAVFRATLGADGNVGEAVLEPGQWHEIAFHWDLGQKRCAFAVDGEEAGVLEVNQPTLNGISYVRFRSTARKLDNAGFLVDRVSVEIKDPYAPACSADEQVEQEKRYIETVVPRWKQG